MEQDPEFKTIRYDESEGMMGSPEKQIKQSTIDQQSEVIDRDRFEGSYKHQDDEQQAQSGNVLYFEMDSNYSPQNSVEDPTRHNK